jgi:hypothetical protein
LETGVFRSYTKKINVELIVVADRADAVVGELNAALDRLEDTRAQGTVTDTA